MHDLIIIGGGPAGLTAGIYASRKKINFCLISEDMGGEPNKTSTIENYPGFQLIEGPQLTKRWEEHFESLNPELKREKVVSVEKNNDHFEVSTQSNQYQARNLLLALGSTPRLLGIPGEKEYKGKGVSFCSTCDAPLFSGKDVAVVGAGNSALETVIDLEKYARKIYLINNTEKFFCDQVYLDRVKNTEQVEILTNTNIKEIKGTNLIEKIIVDENGQGKEISAQGVFINIGYSPNTGLAKGLVEINDAGQIVIDNKNRTSDPNVFAAGDCTSVPFKQIIIAAGEGAKALLSAIENL